MGCKCNEEINKSLAESNGKVETALVLSKSKTRMFESTVIATVKIDKAKRKPVPRLIATFCPFCGTREHPLEAEGDQS